VRVYDAPPGRTFQEFVEAKPHKLLQLSQTRWLSLHSVVDRVLTQYDALKLYFQSELFENKVKSCESIHIMLHDPFTKAYLEFLQYFLPLFVDLNKEFQSEHVQLHVLYNRLVVTYKTILECYLKFNYLKNTDVAEIQFRNPANFVELKNIYLGPKAMHFLGTSQISESDKDQFRKHCLQFLIESAHQLYKRFPFNSAQIKSLNLLSFLNPINIKSTISLGSVAEGFRYFVEDINTLDREWRQLRQLEIDTNKSVVDFWKTVSEIKTGDNQLAFPTLVKLVNSVLCLPHTSAAVERIFSIINYNKSKCRNKLSTDSLSGILHSKRIISRETCYSLTVNREMLRKHCYYIYKK
jgi:hypothetical protein